MRKLLLTPSSSTATATAAAARHHVALRSSSILNNVVCVNSNSSNAASSSATSTQQQQQQQSFLHYNFIKFRHHHHQQQQQHQQQRSFHNRHSSTLANENKNNNEEETKQEDVVEEEEDIVVDEEQDEKMAETLSREGIIEETETVTGAREHKEFQSETKRLMEIVATALYKDKEVFIRELISNASDALEKVRQKMLVGHVEDKDKPLEINISVDEKNHIFTIQDSGIGMTKEEIVKNIGTIAHSGSKLFVQKMQEELGAGSASSEDIAANIIGQFGVGFYSCFMVSDKVRIYTRSAEEGSKGYMWESVGGGNYTISEAEGVARGTKIVMYLKEKEREFAMKDIVEKIIKKYSNFVSHKITLNGSRVNTLDALWLKRKDDVSVDQHKEFYRYLTHHGGDPMYTIQFQTDVPLAIHALFYIPHSHTEKLGMGKMDSGVNVHSRKVLIQAKHPEILPDWLRFVRGVVDSEDLPLNISRESLQDSPLIKRINGILTRKILKFFQDMLKQDRKKYTEFHDEYNRFFKEGIRVDHLYKDDLCKLLLFESSKKPAGEKITLMEYINTMQTDQKNIYYLVAPSRSYAEKSPYFEDFKKQDIEVLFLYDPLDEFVMETIQYFNNKDIKSIERAEAPKKSEDDPKHETEKLSADQVKELSEWFKQIMPTRVEGVTSSTRLSGTPAIINNPESAAMRMIRRYHNQGQALDIGPQKLEINPTHPLIKKLYQARINRPDVAGIVAEQIFDNALISAGLMEDPRSMLGRLTSLLETVTEDIGGEAFTLKEKQE